MSAAHVHDLRAVIATRPHDARLRGLLDDLRALSSEFRELWDGHNDANCSA